MLNRLLMDSPDLLDKYYPYIVPQLRVLAKVPLILASLLFKMIHYLVSRLD